MRQPLAGVTALGKRGFDKLAPGFSEAAEIREGVRKSYESGAAALEEQRDATAAQLERLGELKLDIYDYELRSFVENFNEIKNAELTDLVDPNEPTLEADKELDLNTIDFSAIDGVRAAIAAGGAGATVGLGAYSAAMAFGAASTGTAISALSGAAATNATLAWFGGGSLAAGGGGMAAGAVVLGGIVAIPVLAVGGLVIRSKGKRAVENAKADAAEARKVQAAMSSAGLVARAIEQRASHAETVLRRLRTMFRPMVRDLTRLVLRSNDYNEYDQETREQLRLWTTTAITVRNLLDVDLLDEDGALTVESQRALESAGSFLDRTAAAPARA